MWRKKDLYKSLWSKKHCTALLFGRAAHNKATIILILLIVVCVGVHPLVIVSLKYAWKFGRTLLFEVIKRNNIKN